MVVRRGRYGEFQACSSYPACKAAKPMRLGIACPTEGCTGDLVQRRTKRGRIFYGCNRYPDCKFAAWDRPLNEACPLCHSPYLLQKYSKREGPYIACPNKECDYRRQVETPAGEQAPSPA
jgi:DNA topoisomerase-1